MAALILAMMAATVLEKLKGTELAFSAVYHSPWFFALWGVAAVCGLCWLVSRGVQRHFFTFLLHGAFVVILAGALVTFLTGEQGFIHLRGGEQVAAFETDDGQQKAMPFSLALEDFQVSYYRGSRAPMDYTSRVTVRGDGQPFTAEISMNHILKYKGWRFYQSGFDDDQAGATLAVSHDPWGTGITYTGYLLLLVAMLGFFVQKGTGFRAALRRVGSATLLLAVCCLPAGAKTVVDTPRALPAEVADAFGDLYVYYQDRICPFETMARDYTLKAYGKPRWEDYNANQVVTGWLFYYDWWRVVPFKVKAKDKGTAAEREKGFLLNSTASGDAWKLFPVADSTGTVLWYHANEALPPQVVADYDRWLFIRKALDLVEESVRAEDWPEVLRIVGKIKLYQEKTAADVLPSAAQIRAEKLYNKFSRPRIPFMASITLGLILFVLSAVLMSRGKPYPRRAASGLACLSALLWLYLTGVLGLRWYVSGHAPFAGSYSVMMLMAWLSALLMTLLYRKFPLVQPLGFLMAGFTMLMASMASANPQITHLMPVLQSPLLSLHVLSMMLSYTLFGIVALNGIMGVCVPRGAAILRDVSLLLLYPGVFLLTFGTFLGAVWANISWGSYWAWDPKETWALVTLLLYAATLHSGSLGSGDATRARGFRNPRFFHIYCIFAFLAVLITYFGVNLILGGMHSYA
ncbi:MAG: cytochrome c biogenesis protein CcsA [Bacteroidales bacterium]|nr:cytochrome c biogenesis protein CcsA [Bacteroidales bacterium]